MKRLWNSSRRTGFALVIALGLTVLPGIIAPMVSDGMVPGVDQVFAEESFPGGG